MVGDLIVLLINFSDVSVPVPDIDTLFNFFWLFCFLINSFLAFWFRTTFECVLVAGMRVGVEVGVGGGGATVSCGTG